MADQKLAQMPSNVINDPKMTKMAYVSSTWDGHETERERA